MALSRLRILIEAKNAGKAAFNDAANDVSGLDEKIKKIGQTLAVAFAAKAALGVAKLGAQVERTERRFEAFSSQAGGSAAIMEAFQKGAGGAADKMTAMTQAGKLLQMGIVNNASSMETMVEMATRLGDQTQSVAERTENWALMMANTSIPRLDAYGISAGAVRARMKELQTTTADLSREEAFAIAVREEGAKALELLGPRADDALMSFEKMEAKLADTTAEIGQKLAPAVVKLLDAFTGLLGAVSPLIDLIGGLEAETILMTAGLLGGAKAATSLAGGLTPLAAKLGTTAVGLGAVAIAGVALIGVYQGIKNVQKQVAEGEERVSDELSKWGDEAQKALDSGASLSDVMTTLAGRTNDASSALEKGGIVADVFIRNQTGVITGITAEAEAVLNTATTWEEYETALMAFNSTSTDTHGQIEGLTKGQWDLANGVGIAAAEVSNWDYNARLAAEAADKMRVATALTKDELAQVDSAMSSYDAALLTVAGTQAKYTTEQAKTINRGRELAAAQSEATAAIERQQAAMTAAAGASAGLTAASTQLSAAERLGMITADEHRAAEQALQIALGLASSAEIQAQNDVLLLARAHATGIITAREYAATIAAIEDGTLELTDAQRSEIRSSTDQIWAMHEKVKVGGGVTSSIKDQAAALQDLQKSQLGSAESLKDAGPAQIAKAAISGLDRQLSQGLISFEQYQQAVTQVQDTFGLVTPQSRQLARGMDILNAALATGGIDAENYDDILARMNDAAADGEEGVNALFSEFGVAAQEVDPAAQAVDAFGGSARDARDPVTGLTSDTDILYGSLDNITAKPWVITLTTSGSWDIGGGEEGRGGVKSNDNQMGTMRVPGPIGRKRLAVVEGGEFIGNPYQYGAVGGPGGPRPPSAGGGDTYGGDTYNIYDPMTGALVLERQRERASRRMTGRM